MATIKTGKVGTAIVGSDHVNWCAVYFKIRINIKNDSILKVIIPG